MSEEKRDLFVSLRDTSGRSIDILSLKHTYNWVLACVTGPALSQASENVSMLVHNSISSTFRAMRSTVESYTEYIINKET